MVGSEDLLMAKRKYGPHYAGTIPQSGEEGDRLFS
jgi:hypothetical protein